jgi:hypothetical protein
MEVRDSDVARIPAENLRVALQEFAAVWTEAEAAAARAHDWYAYGVASTCRWLACTTVRPAQGPWHPAPAPVTQRTGQATPELIQKECLEAELLAIGDPPDWLTKRPRWLEGVCATLDWAWRRTGTAPMKVGRPMS